MTTFAGIDIFWIEVGIFCCSALLACGFQYVAGPGSVPTCGSDRPGLLLRAAFAVRKGVHHVRVLSGCVAVGVASALVPLGLMLGFLGGSHEFFSRLSHIIL